MSIVVILCFLENNDKKGKDYVVSSDNFFPPEYCSLQNNKFDLQLVESVNVDTGVNCISVSSSVK